MLLPIGDTPNPATTPVVTRSLIVINVAIFLLVSVPLLRPLAAADLEDVGVVSTLEAMWELQGARLAGRQGEWLASLSHYDLFVFEHGYLPAQPSWLDLLSSLFLHGSFMHLAGNMLFLWIFGDNVEARLGRWGFLVAYLATGVAATFAFDAMEAVGTSPLIGASGAISGVLGFYFIWFPRNHVKFLLAFWPFLITTLHVRAYWALMFYFVVQNVFPAMAGTQDGVAYGAHIGGFVAGAVGALVLGRLLPQPTTGPARPARGPRRSSGFGVPVGGRWSASRSGHGSDVVDDPVAEFVRLLRSGRMAEAAAAFPRLTQAPGSPRAEDVFRLAQWLAQRDDRVGAEAVSRYFLKRFPRGPGLDATHLLLGELMMLDGDRYVAARAHLLDALDVTDPNGPVARRARSLLREM